MAHHADDAEERSGPRGGARRHRLGARLLGLARAGRDLPAAAAAPRSGSSLALRILGWAALVLAVVAGGTAGGAYLYVHESVAAVAPRSVEVKKALKSLDVPLPGQPATALVIGYDRRASDAQERAVPLRHADARPRRPGREDDLDALLPARPPGRDPLPGPERVDRQDQRRLLGLRRTRARSRPCGSSPGVPINYIITVNFRGFRQLVDRLGGVWMDIDRRYFNDHGGPTGYAKINLQPGYQRLTGLRALDFVRFRHTDSDLYRNARQQLFVRAFKDQIESAFSLTRLPQLIKVITSNVEVGQGGGKDVSPKTVLSYGALAYSLAGGARLPVADRRARGLRRPHHLAGEHRQGDPRVPEPGRRVAAQGDRRGARREAQAEGPAAARDDRHGPQRQRRRGLRVDRELPPLAARLPDGPAAERPARQRADLRLLPHRRSTSTRARRAPSRRRASSPTCSGPPT